MYLYQVGKPYHPNRDTPWPETPHLRVAPEGVELALFLRDPTPREIAAVSTGVATFAWIDTDHVAVLAFRIQPGVPWSDCPYNPHLFRNAGEPAGPPVAYGTAEHQLILVTLVEATSGVIMALRQLTWSPRFVQAVGTSIERMLATPWSQADHDATLGALYGRYTDTAELVRARATVTCTGGSHDDSTRSGG